MSLIVKFSRTALREKVTSLVNELEGSSSINDLEQTEAVSTATEIQASALKVCENLAELINKAEEEGIDTTDYSDMVDQINSDFQLKASSEVSK